MPPLKKMAAADTRTAAARANLSAAGIAALDPALDASANLDLLMKRGLLSDAVRFLAHSLPKREAVWWACLCARDMLPADAAPALLAAVQAAEGWVMAPSEEKRREAMVTAEAAGFRAPASWAAVAAFWSGGSMAPPNAPVVPRPSTGGPANRSRGISPVPRLLGVFGAPHSLFWLIDMVLSAVMPQAQARIGLSKRIPCHQCG